MTSEERATLQREAGAIRKAYLRYIGDLSGKPESQQERMALVDRYEEIEGLLANSSISIDFSDDLDDIPRQSSLPLIYSGKTDPEVMGETAAEEMILRMEAWNIRLCLRKFRKKKPVDDEIMQQFQARYSVLNDLLATDRYSDTNCCSFPELSPEI